MSSAFKKKKRPQGSTSTSSGFTSILSSAADSQDQDQLEPDLSETLEDLLALRKLKRSVGGIELERLNAGEKKKKKLNPVAADGGGSGEVVASDGMIEGTKGGLSAKPDRMRDVEPDEVDDPGAITRRLVKSNNFTGQTNAVDVDKHMMAYIEAELRKRKAPTEQDGFNAEKEMESLDPHDALYKVAEKYRIEKQQVVEGNVTLSAAMLTAIPEVDLGIDIRLKNIEETEKAKRVLYEERQAASKEEDEFASDRFYRARRPMESDSDALAKARKEAARVLAQGTEEKKPSNGGGAGRRETATDDQVMDRFKKRQHGKK